MRSVRAIVGWAGRLALAAALAGTPIRIGRAVEDVAATASPDALERVRAGVAAHPDDPDLTWALARQLAREGRAKQSLEATHRFLARWPQRRPEARVEIARTLLDRGVAPEALVLLSEEVRRAPSSGIAHFYRGMAMRASGDRDAASRELQAAALLEPALRGETLLVRALLAFDGGREQEAVTLLQELLRIDPTSDTAVRARLLLREHEVAGGQKRLRAEALAGFEWDDNVTLQGSETETGASNRADFRGVFGASVSGQPWLTKRAGLLVGYRYDQTQHIDLQDFNLIQNALFASLSLQPNASLADRLALRFDGFAYDTLQDLHRALTGGSFRPNLLWAIGPRAGVVRVFGSFEFAEFHGEATFDPWKRDALTGGVGLEQTVPLPQRGASIAVSASWVRSVTDATPNDSNDGFDGDFDYDSYRARALGTFTLPYSIQTQIEASYSRDEYLNDNFANAIATEFLETKPRRDDVIAGRIGLSRAIARFTRLEIYWRATHRASNVAVFDYDKNIVGLLVHVSSD